MNGRRIQPKQIPNVEPPENKVLAMILVNAKRIAKLKIPCAHLNELSASRIKKYPIIANMVG